MRSPRGSEILLSAGNPKIGLVSSGDSLTLASKQAGNGWAAPFHQLYDIQRPWISANRCPRRCKRCVLIGPQKVLTDVELANLAAYTSSGGVVGRLLLNKYAVRSHRIFRGEAVGHSVSTDTCCNGD